MFQEVGGMRHLHFTVWKWQLTGTTLLSATHYLLFELPATDDVTDDATRGFYKSKQD